MTISNHIRFFGKIGWSERLYQRLKKNKEGDKSAAACKRCGQCEPECPNDVPIIQELAALEARLG